MARNFNVKFDATGLETLETKLAALDGGVFGKAAMQAVNLVTDRAYDLVRKRMNAGINLEDQYISKKLSKQRATNPSAPRATITASGDLTILGRYSPKVILRPAKRPSRGDASRGVPAGLKASGVSVEVTRGNRKDIDNGFLMKLRNGNGIGVFTRDPATGAVRHRYGPTVYQLFRVQTDVSREEIADDLQDTAEELVAEAIRKALK